MQWCLSIIFLSNLLVCFTGMCCFCPTLSWSTNSLGSAPDWEDSSTTSPHPSAETCRSSASVWKHHCRATQSGHLQWSLSTPSSSLNVAKHHSWPITNYNGLKEQYFEYATKQSALTRPDFGFKNCTSMVRCHDTLPTNNQKKAAIFMCWY